MADEGSIPAEEAGAPDGIVTPAPDDRFAQSLRGLGPIGILAILVILLVGNYPIAPAGGLLVLLWAWRSGTPWRDLGLVRPASWMRTAVIGIVFGSIFKIMMKAVVMPMLGADPINQAYHYLAGNRAALPMMVYTIVAGAGFGEEMVFRGFAFERLGRMIGRSMWARVITVAITSVWFGLEHYPQQGLAGAQQATLVGLVFGTIAAVTGRIVMLMIAHAAFDLTALAIIYWNLETAVSHLIFK